MSSGAAHVSTFVVILVLDAMWLYATGRIDPYVENAETMFFALLSRVLVYAWVMYTVVPSIYCSYDTSFKNVALVGAIKGFTTFGMWNFATVDSFTDVGMPLLDTLWGMALTVAASALTVRVDGR